MKLSADVEGRQEMSADEDPMIVCATKIGKTCPMLKSQQQRMRSSSLATSG